MAADRDLYKKCFRRVMESFGAEVHEEVHPEKWDEGKIPLDVQGPEDQEEDDEEDMVAIDSQLMARVFASHFEGPGIQVQTNVAISRDLPQMDMLVFLEQAADQARVHAATRFNYYRTYNYVEFYGTEEPLTPSE